MTEAATDGRRHALGHRRSVSREEARPKRRILGAGRRIRIARSPASLGIHHSVRTVELNRALDKGRLQTGRVRCARGPQNTGFVRYPGRARYRRSAASRKVTHGRLNLGLGNRIPSLSTTEATNLVRPLRTIDNSRRHRARDYRGSSARSSRHKRKTGNSDSKFSRPPPERELPKRCRLDVKFLTGAAGIRASMPETSHNTRLSDQRPADKRHCVAAAFSCRFDMFRGNDEGARVDPRRAASVSWPVLC